MIRVVISIVLCAAFAVLFGLVPHRTCSGHCAGCSGACGRLDKQGDDDVR